jgi:hypothetical protein
MIMCAFSPSPHSSKMTWTVVGGDPFHHGSYMSSKFTNAFLKTTVRNNVSVLDFIVHYGGFKKSISGYTRNRMQNPTIKSSKFTTRKICCECQNLLANFYSQDAGHIVHNI